MEATVRRLVDTLSGLHATKDSQRKEEGEYHDRKPVVRSQGQPVKNRMRPEQSGGAFGSRLIHALPTSENPLGAGAVALLDRVHAVILLHSIPSSSNRSSSDSLTRVVGLF